MIRNLIIALGIFAGSAPVWADTFGGGAYTDKHLTSRTYEPRSEPPPRGAPAPAQMREATPIVQTGGRAPLARALDHLVPQDCWRIMIERGVEDVEVLWGAGLPWTEELQRMLAAAGLYARVSKEDCLITVARDLETAVAMSQPGWNPDLPELEWIVEAGVPLAVTFEKWAQQYNDAIGVDERDGWKIQWKPGYNMIPEVSASLKGTLPDAVRTVLAAQRENEGSLLIATEHANHAIVIHEQ